MCHNTWPQFPFWGAISIILDPILLDYIASKSEGSTCVYIRKRITATGHHPRLCSSLCFRGKDFTEGTRSPVPGVYFLYKYVLRLWLTRGFNIAQKLRILAVLPEKVGSIPSPALLAPNCLELQFQGTYRPLLVSVGTRHIHDKN